MPLPFFYEPAIPQTGSHFTLSEETSKHCIQVLRMKTGAYLNLTDGKGKLYKAGILSEDKRKTIVLIEQEESMGQPLKKVCIAVSLLKNVHRFEWFLEKATEIGITEIQPLICDHTEHERFRHDRMNGILISAMLQSRQTWLPRLQEPVQSAEFITQARFTQKLIAHCEDGRKQLLTEVPPSDDSTILIGPEGDFSPDEIRLALDNHFMPVSLGNTRLRAETAAIVASSLLMFR